jgi:nitrite reductase/ring-hydroxylating ferredoxin subunit
MPRITIPTAQVAADKAATLSVGEGLTVAVFLVNGKYHAMDDRCPHKRKSLAGGIVDGNEVVCPAHGFRFNVETGACKYARHLRARIFPVSVQGDLLHIDVPETQSAQ